MAVYHLTLHAYRSWSPSHPRGYCKRDEGYQPADRDKAHDYDERAKFPRVYFDTPIQEILIVGAYDICSRRNWRLHAVGTDPSHAHFLVSWRGFVDWRDVLNKLKNVLSFLLGRSLNRPGGHWFVQEGSRKWVRTRGHFDYLLTEYLPDHPGVFWHEGLALPEDRWGILEM